MVEPVTDLDTAHVRSNLERIREQAGPEIEILAATKYIRAEDMGALAEAGVELVGENRLQDLEEKHERWGDRFTWDFIGNLQSRKVKRILPLVRLIHSVASDSVLEQLGQPRGSRHRGAGGGQPLGRGGKGRHRAREPRRLHRALPGDGLGADDDAAVHRGPGGLAAVFRAARRSSPPSAASSGSRWARARIGGSRWRRGRRYPSPGLPCFGHNRSTSAWQE